MKCRIEIQMDNAAFKEGGYDGEVELARILLKLAHDVDVEGLVDRTLHDNNGNTVGQMTIKK